MPLPINRRQARELIRLLGNLQQHLEGAIESCIPRPIPDSGLDRLGVLMSAEIEDEYAENIKLDRRDWKRAERWVRRLEAVRG
jgi:hypothetical protein